MIQEIIDFVKHMEQDYPEAFELNRKPSPGLHLWVGLDENGKWKNNDPQEGEDYVVYDGKSELKGKEFDARDYWEYGRTVGGITNTNKCLDLPAKKIHSTSPFIVAFKRKEIEKIKDRLIFYFSKAIEVCLDEEEELLKQQCLSFRDSIPEIISKIKTLQTVVLKKNKEEEGIELIKTIKDVEYINIYLKNIDIAEYQKAHERYLRCKLFNINDYNSSKEIDDKTWGISNFINGTGVKFTKKPFLQHKTASFFKGVSGRVQSKDSLILNKFDCLLSTRVLPNPLPIFVDKAEFQTNAEIIRIFNEERERKLTYPQILKALYEKDEQRVLANYYLLNISWGVVNDFDFVSNFQYRLEKCKIENLFQVKQNKEIAKSIKLKTIFGFENYIVRKIFNNALVKETKNGLSYNYFNEIDPNYVSGGNDIANLILRFRKAFYDYIYKSRKQAITQTMFDEIMLTSIISDVRHDDQHNKEYSIKEKLNIWFSLSEFFNNKLTNIIMENKFKELLEKMKLVANDDNTYFSNDVAEFLFGAGQVIYYLLSRSKASKPSHALLEPFLQKTTAPQLQNAIANAVNIYKHDISFGKGRFERLCAQVLAFDTSENMKNYQRYLLAGYFAPAVIYTKSEETTSVTFNI
ncbi:MAG: hypothetical protein GXO81_11840 [Chlorobi bacterium]|nr:hypothetical protein [Chlorobiota bacterium]